MFIQLFCSFLQYVFFFLVVRVLEKQLLEGHLACKFKLFHISFRDFLQEEILPKVKKPPLVDSDEWENNEPGAKRIR